jgi:hypothetical protein
MAKENQNIKNIDVKPYNVVEPVMQEMSDDQKFSETKDGILREEKIKNFKQKMKGRLQIPKPLKK